jgi:hypothetical protein
MKNTPRAFKKWFNRLRSPADIYYAEITSGEPAPLRCLHRESLRDVLRRQYKRNCKRNEIQRLLVPHETHDHPKSKCVCRIQDDCPF